MDQLDEILNTASGQIWQIFNTDTVICIDHTTCSGFPNLFKNKIFV